MPKKKQPNFQQIHVRLSNDTFQKLSGMLEQKKEQGQPRMSQSLFIEKACKFYIDYLNLNDSALLNQEILSLVKSMMTVTEDRINNKSNQLLSSIAIELGTLQQIVGNALTITPEEVKVYREDSVAFIKTNNRILKMKEIINE